jgi:hypothetical protein
MYVVVNSKGVGLAPGSGKKSRAALEMFASP